MVWVPPAVLKTTGTNSNSMLTVWFRRNERSTRNVLEDRQTGRYGSRPRIATVVNCRSLIGPVPRRASHLFPRPQPKWTRLRDVTVCPRGTCTYTSVYYIYLYHSYFSPLHSRFIAKIIITVVGDAVSTIVVFSHFYSRNSVITIIDFVGRARLWCVIDSARMNSHIEIPSIEYVHYTIRRVQCTVIKQKSIYTMRYEFCNRLTRSSHKENQN